MILGAEIATTTSIDLPEVERAASARRRAALRSPPPRRSSRGRPSRRSRSASVRARSSTTIRQGRFGARGRRAQELLADAPWHDYYGPGSPLDRFCRIGGRVLRTGRESRHDDRAALRRISRRRARQAPRPPSLSSAGAQTAPRRASSNASTTSTASSTGRARIISRPSCASISPRAAQRGPRRAGRKRADRGRRSRRFRHGLDDHAIPGPPKRRGYCRSRRPGK